MQLEGSHLLDECVCRSVGIETFGRILLTNKRGKFGGEFCILFHRQLKVKMIKRSESLVLNVYYGFRGFTVFKLFICEGKCKIDALI